MIEAWQRLRHLAGVYRHVKHYIDEVEYIEQAAGYVSDADLNRLIMRYGTEALQKLRVQVKTKGSEPMPQAGLLVGNHISYLDMPVLMSQSPVQFVAKHEVQYFPIMGRGAKKAGTVFVKRGQKHSRKDVGYAVANAILHDQKRIVIFPSGTTTVDENKPWRWGPFRIAADHDLWIQPFRLRYTPLRKVAYIDRDFFPVHLWKLLDHQGITAEIEYADPLKVEDAQADAERWWNWSREFLVSEQRQSLILTQETSPVQG